MQPEKRFNSKKWLRRLHAWTGFFCLFLLLMYSLTGLWLNHRAVWKIPGPHTDKKSVQITLDAPFQNPEDLRQFMRQTYPAGFDSKVRVTPAETLPVPGGTLNLPARWELRDGTLTEGISATYISGTLLLKVERMQPNAMAILNRLHKGTGTGLAWQLFSDLAVLALLLLVFSSLFLWTKLHGRPGLAWGLLIGGATLSVLFAALPVIL